MVIYIAIIFYSDYQEFSKRIIDINLVFLPLILFFHTLSIVVKAFRQKVLLSGIGIDLNFKENFLIFLGGLSMIITPAGLGSMIKSQFLKKNHGHSISKTMPIVLIEKFNDALAAITIVSIFTLVNNMLEIQILMIFLSLIIASVYFIIRYERIFNYIVNKISKIRFLKKYASNIFESKNTLLTLSKHKINQ